MQNIAYLVILILAGSLLYIVIAGVAPGLCEGAKKNETSGPEQDLLQPVPMDGIEGVSSGASWRWPSGSTRSRRR